MFLALAAAACVFVAVVAAILLMVEGSVSSRLTERRLGEIGSREPGAEWLEGSDLLLRERSSTPILRHLLDSSGWSDRAAAQLERAGIRLKVGEYFLLRLLVALLAAIFVLLFARATTLGIVVAMVAAVVGYLAPAFYVHMAKQRRVRNVNGQLAETLELISNALRSGFAFAQAVELTAAQMPSPIRDDLNALLRDLGLGARMDDALRSLADRTASIDMELVVTTIMIQRTTGGNLSEVLDNVAATIKERERLHGEVRALTAQQRLTGLVLSVYPLALGLFLALIAPSIMKYLWQDQLGQILLAIAVVLQCAGIFAIQRITNIEV